MALTKKPYDSRATTEDMANALRNASGGTDTQKFKDLQNYNINTQAPVQRGLMEEMLKEGYGQTTAPSYASPLGSLEEYMSGFREFEQNNPYSGAGTAAMMPATLPGGFRYNFTGSQQANKFNDYLESIGQAPYERYADESMIAKFANGGGIGSMMQPKSKTGKAINQLQSKAPEGEFLAYINPDEAAMLKRAGGSGEPVNGIPSFRPQDMGNKSNQKSSASRTSSSSKGPDKGTGGSKGNLGGGGGGQESNYIRYSPPTKKTYTAKTIDSKPVTGNDYRDSKNDFVNTLNKNNQIAAAQNNTRFTPYQGGARTSSYYNQNPLSGLLKLAAGFAFPGASFFLNKGSKLKDGIMNLNDSIQNSDFGRSTSFADYRDIKSFGGYDEREMAKQINKDEAKNLQARIDGGEFGGFERPTQTFTFDNSKMKPPAEVKGLDTSFYENENSIGMGSAPTGVMKPGGFTNALYDGRYAPVPNNSTPYTMGSVPFSPALGNTQPQELSMMEKYYNDIDNKATGPNIVQDASEIAQQAKVFGLQDLQGIGALEEGKVFGYNTTDQGDALEKFRENASSMNNPQGVFKEYKGADVQTLFDQLLQNKNENVTQNQDYIQNAINQGFLENQTDFQNQKSLEDFT